MNEKIRQQFEEQLVYLPEINQRALRSFDWATELVSIGKTYGLHIDELEDLQIETMLLLVGLTSPDEYEKELIERLAISPIEAEKIIQDVNKHIFSPIHDYIVSGGAKAQTTPTTIMESAGLQMTNDETPVQTTPDVLVRVGGSVATVQSIPESKPLPTSPLQFHPTAEKSTEPVLPEITIPKPPNIILSKEKLEQVSQNRQKVIDETLQSMDQVS